MLVAVTDKLTFDDFLDLVLSGLYELDESAPGELFDVNEIAAAVRAIGETIPENWPSDAVKLLDDEGWIIGLRAFGGVAEGRLTGAGRLEVERRRAAALQKPERAERGLASSSTVLIISGSGNQVAVGVEGSVVQTALSQDVRNEALARVSELDATIRRDEALTRLEREELLADVSSVRHQLEKQKPNTNAAVALLEPLANVASISNSVASLIGLLT